MFLKFVSIICLSTILMTEKIQGQEIWKQGCQSQKKISVDLRNTQSADECGRRNFEPLYDPAEGIASPGEFPWLCLLFTGKETGSDRFLGGCAIVPENKNNDISKGTTSRVITAFHKLRSLQGPERLVVKIIKPRPGASLTKIDIRGGASDFFNLDNKNSITEEYTVIKFIMHPEFDPKRLTNDLGILIVDRPIQLSSKSGVNAACYPQCENMFDHVFSNGTGTRCWVAGYGREPGSDTPSFVQRKVDIPIYPNRAECNNRLKNALPAARQPDFQLSPGEICAGGEIGKDTCDGDGGAPLVCQSETGQWHVVGLTAWGIGCDTALPAVYVNIFHYLDFITDPKFN